MELEYQDFKLTRLQGSLPRARLARRENSDHTSTTYRGSVPVPRGRGGGRIHEATAYGVPVADAVLWVLESSTKVPRTTDTTQADSGFG